MVSLHVEHTPHHFYKIARINAALMVGRIDRSPHGAAVAYVGNAAESTFTQYGPEWLKQLAARSQCQSLSQNQQIGRQVAVEGMQFSCKGAAGLGKGCTLS